MHTHTRTCTLTHVHAHMQHTQTQHTDIADTFMLTICKIDNNKKRIYNTQYNPTAPFIVFKIPYFIELSSGHRWSVNRVQISFESLLTLVMKNPGH